MIPRTKIENASWDLIRALGAKGDDPIRRFQEALSHRLSLPLPLLTSCASAAFYFLLKAMPGRKIYLPAYTCRALFEACHFAERMHDVRLVDIDLETFGMSLEALEKGIEPGSLIVATHQFGIPADMVRFCAIAERTGGLVVEDAAAAFGARFNGREAGTFGDVSLFSFDHTKTLSACGGGAAFFKDTSLQKEVERLAQAEIEPEANPGPSPILRGLAYNTATQDQVYGGITWPMWTWRNGPYQDHGELRSDRLLIYRRPFGENQAAAGLRSLASIDDVLKRRKEIENKYLGHLKGRPKFASYIPLPNSQTSLVLFPVRLVGGDKADFVRRCNEGGIDLGFTFSYINANGRPLGGLENSELAARQVVNLPLYSKLTQRQVSAVCKAITEGF